MARGSENNYFRKTHENRKQLWPKVAIGFHSNVRTPIQVPNNGPLSRRDSSFLRFYRSFAMRSPVLLSTATDQGQLAIKRVQMIFVGKSRSTSERPKTTTTNICDCISIFVLCVSLGHTECVTDACVEQRDTNAWMVR